MKMKKSIPCRELNPGRQHGDVSEYPHALPTELSWNDNVLSFALTC